MQNKRRLRVHDPHRFLLSTVYRPGHNNARTVKIWEELPARGLPRKSVRKFRCHAAALHQLGDGKSRHPDRLALRELDVRDERDGEMPTPHSSGCSFRRPTRDDVDDAVVETHRLAREYARQAV
jgi:hypothetical protein